MKKFKLSFLFGLMMILLTGLGSARETVEAKSTPEGTYKIESDKWTKIGKYYYRDYSDGIYVKSASSESGDNIIPKNKNSMTWNYDHYFSGGYIYYSYHNSNTNKDTLYRMKLNGSNQKKIKTLKQKSYGGEIYLVYEKNIYFCWSEYDFDGFVDYGKEKFMCRYNMSSKKEKYYKELICGFGENYKQYYLTLYDGGESAFQGYILNAKTGKLSGLDKYANSAKILGKKIYYTTQGKDYKENYLYTCTLTGRNKKKLATVKGNGSMSYIVQINKKYIKLYVSDFTGGGSYYKYTFSSKKLKKIK